MLLRLTLVTRTECHLCEQMHGQIEALRAQRDLPALEIVDVDSDPLLQRRFGLKVPVLLLNGSLVCFGQLDAGKLGRALETAAGSRA